jgi:hypothetical protein
MENDTELGLNQGKAHEEQSLVEKSSHHKRKNRDHGVDHTDAYDAADRHDKSDVTESSDKTDKLGVGYDKKVDAADKFDSANYHDIADQHANTGVTTHADNDFIHDGERHDHAKNMIKAKIKQKK